LARQGGRMLQASPEGTAFEIAKGRYSETANFDVYLKGHAGDPLRTDRVSRECDAVEQPALSLALAPQPDVIRGLAAPASMRGRGSRARLRSALPVSVVGGRDVGLPPVPAAAADRYHELMLTLWRIPAQPDGEDGKPDQHVIRFSASADAVLQELERWLEPQLAEGEPLSHLAGWASKLAGAIARPARVPPGARRLAHRPRS